MQIIKGSLENLNSVIDLTNIVFRPKEKSMRIETPLMWAEENIKAGNHFIIKEGKKVVSFIGMIEEEINIFGYRLKIGNIGNVCTHPDYRGKGYASLLLEQAIRKAKKDKLAYLMISGARGLYKKAGAVSIPFYFYQLKGSRTKTDFVIRRYNEKFYASCMQIYQREIVRFIRKKDFRRIFSLYNGEFQRKVMHAESRIYVISKNKDILGYWVEGRSKNGIIIGGRKEYAGMREFLAKAWKSRGKGEIMDISVPLWDEELRYYLGKEKEIGASGVTVLLLNPADFIKSLEGYFKERGVKFTGLKKERKFLLKGDLAKKRFKDISELATFLFSFDGKMTRETPWKNILPLPIPCYGFNYA